jgi:hypothetical protein
MRTRWIVLSALVLLGLLGAQSTGYGQADAVTPDLKTRLQARFDVVALQQGVALVPLQATSNVRMIQIVGGVVTVDGESLTGQQLRDRLGTDSDLVLQASYLDPQRQRELAGASQPAPMPPASQTPQDRSQTQVTTGDVVRFGGDVSVGQDERIQGDVVALGGAVDVQGEVTGDLVAIGGGVTLGPQAVVGGDLNVVGGGLTRAPGARVMGSVHEVGGGASGFGRGGRWSTGFGSFWPRFGSLAATVFRMTLLVLLGLIAVAFARRPIERIAARTAETPVRAGLIGLLAEILFVPTLTLVAVVLAVSIVGIPLLALLPFAVLLVVLVMLVGFIALGYQVGTRLLTRLGWSDRGDYLAVAMGILAIGCLTVIAKLTALAAGSIVGVPLTMLGYVVEYIAWTVGFGATIMALYETQARTRRGVPPTVTPPTVDPAPA